MAFGWSLTKLMVVLAAAVLLFGVPLLTFLVILKERYEKRTKRNRRS
jgi:hypothetical protein